MMAAVEVFVAFQVLGSEGGALPRCFATVGPSVTGQTKLPVHADLGRGATPVAAWDRSEIDDRQVCSNHIHRNGVSGAAYRRHDGNRE